eukprot:Hpha_TRINITY_DN13661_c0_g2::TRINITY_DN13661_c0_g2_i1::g.122815::m.122815
MMRAIGSKPRLALLGISRRWKHEILPAEELRWRVDADKFSFANTKEVGSMKGLIGQDPAVRQIKTGVSTPGQNVIVCGEHGTGKRTAIRQHTRGTWRSTTAASGETSDKPHSTHDIVAIPNAGGTLDCCAVEQGEAIALSNAVKKLITSVTALWAKNLNPDGLDEDDLLTPAKKKKKSKFLPIELVTHVTEKIGAIRMMLGSGCISFKELHKYLCLLEKKLLDSKTFTGDAIDSTDKLGVTVICGAKKGFKWPKRPVVWVNSTSTASLLGEFKGGQFVPGSLLQAHGGVLVVPAEKLCEDTEAWDAVKTLVHHGKVDVSDMVEGLLRPATVDVKVVLLGDENALDTLENDDVNFQRTFRFRVDLTDEARATEVMVYKKYPAVLAQLCKRENLLPLSGEAVAEVIEHSARMSSRRTMLTLHFGAIADLLREAHYWATEECSQTVLVRHIRTALRERSRRSTAEYNERERVRQGELLIDTMGESMGQVNGLVVYTVNGHSYGSASRITAVTSVGERGVINIERECNMSGDSHSKGMHIVDGFLRSRFAQKTRLALSASVCFEQSFSNVDGDSASSAEIYAILSALSGLPLRQDVGVTGSVNQKGFIQPVGGINEKIEGFFDCVKAATGTQKRARPAAVLIPRNNLHNLQLRHDIVEAVQTGKFEVHAIDTVEEGIEVLTGISAGWRGPHSTEFAPNTVFGRVAQKLAEYSKADKRASTSPYSPRRRRAAPRRSAVSPAPPEPVPARHVPLEPASVDISTIPSEPIVSSEQVTSCV